ncbi:TPA: RepB family plasmid replication initiator protein [Vibrio parahaemolyticus]|nr:RepB family plasmid replication initiator protein [Vibrio parahaemolyticus]HCG9257366.1 RepB family plasmid replication initiator protein [Vibrio parahaemolyticus]HCG9526970.1 RepB family plasmid replication initiator protein [Vibrio parahaemolyticus]HCH4733485.1 RepB family plasmid replication initiator protein [Vibrio parahaemolyticus]
MDAITTTKKTSSNDVILRQANALTGAAYSLSINEKRLVYMAIEAINNKTVTRNEHGAYPVEISTTRFCQLFGTDVTHAGRDLNKAATDLNKREVVFYLPSEDGDDGERAQDALSWTTRRSYRPRKGTITLYFNSEVIELIRNLDKNYTMFLMIEAGCLSNPHTMRLYETLRQWCRQGVVTLGVDWICKKFELPATYQARMPDFRRRFLNPSVAEITNSTNLNVVSVELPPTKGRRVDKILFSIIDKTVAPDVERDTMHYAISLMGRALSGEDLEPEELKILRTNINSICATAKIPIPSKLKTIIAMR